MAWYTIKGTCGHEFRKQLYGKVSQRESYISWAEDNLVCPDCYKAEQDKKKSDAAAKAKAEAEAENLVPLIGSEKQVQWAEVIRINKLSKLREIAGELINKRESCVNYIPIIGSTTTADEIIEWIKNKIADMKGEDSAKWFIDNRGTEYSLSWVNEKIEKEKARNRAKDIVG